MYPLLFIPNMKNPEQEYLQQLPVTYDLKYCEGDGYGKQCISISEKKKIGEPLYQVVINTVRVMPEETVCQFELGEVTPGLVTKTWTTRIVRKTKEGNKEVLARTVVNNGTHYTITKDPEISSNSFTETITKEVKVNKKEKKKNKNKKPIEEPKKEDSIEAENIIKIPIETLDNFLSVPAAAVLEKLFAQQKTVACLKNLKTLNESGEIMNISYESDQEEDSMELRRIEHQDNGDGVTTTTNLDYEGNILTCLTGCGNWVRDGSVKLVEMILPSPTCLALYQEGRLEKLLKAERYRKQQTVFTDVCKDILQHILLNKPEKPLTEMKEYLMQLKMERTF